MVSFLQAENISRRIGDRVLFEDISLNINREDKIAVIAVNGAGKSSLLDILAGKESPDSGNLSLRRDIRISYLSQYPELIETNTVLDELFSTDSIVVQTIKNYEKCLFSGNNEDMHAALQAMDDHKAWDYEVSVKQILFRLQLTDLDLPVNVLSGGQKKRLALAKVLVEDADLLILDEPTNHLDIEMVEWLEEFLIKSNKTIILVTHDRYFLDRVCNIILELSDGVIFRYNGNYEFFLEKKQEREYVERSGSEKARNLLRTELEWMRRMPRARRHKSKSRIESFHDLRKKSAVSYQKNTIDINVRAARMGGKILEVRNIWKSFGDLKLINDFSYSFSRFEKVGLIGKNGTGKTTLLNILTGITGPDKGIVERGETVVFGYYRQEGIQFDDQMTVLDAAKKISETVVLGNGNTISISQFLNMFLFPPDRQNTLIRKLSGGEKRRLYLLTVLMHNPNFLILDEPTNDLDIITLNILEDYLGMFKGCVIIVSHDRYFMDKIVDHIFEFRDNGIIRDFPGNYTQLRNNYEDESEIRENDADREIQVISAAMNDSEILRNRKRGLTYGEKKEFENLEAEIKTLETEKARIEDELAGGISDHDHLVYVSNRHGQIMKLLDEKELRWLILSEKAG